MVETIWNLSYHRVMSRTATTKTMNRHWASLVQSLDVRTRPGSVAPPPGQSVEEAWTTTGTYLRQALHNYGRQASRNRSGRQTG